MTIKKLMVAAGLAFAASASQAEPLNIGFVYVGPVGDAGWTYGHDAARKAVEEKFGDKVKTTYVESVAEGADSARVIRNLAQKGNELIFTTSFGYMNPTLKVARKFPKVKFEHATGYKQGKNVGNYMARAYQGRYLTGLVAGSMTESNTLGYVASFPIPEVVRGINAFTKGAREVNPDVKVKVIWISSWYDPAKEREAAETLMLQGADVLTQHTDSAAVIQAAEAKGKYAIGYHTDMSAYGKSAHLTSTIHNWAPLYIAKAEAVMNGTWESQSLWYGLKEGVTDIAPFNAAVPAEVRTLVEEKKAQIKAGELQVFAGPIKDQQGTERVKVNESLADDDLKGMNWHVEGVDSKLPEA
ncbi:BMP family ABC transporter substrate-binding protein [Bacterioplanes sanyensis]|uniref:BMP family ABC transporter substrate-binding protein n=1 Tax=Bacterioplanes sanyensis TaxID=1249553 RepID=UPI0016755D3B|nr:BMP family ABC transporter substrate-binding protein [Bacterioplanes sanyensis]GGY36841.1 BMP family ABC transporter substrate-binding protein [Bacterioplanes sanyensis]